MCNLLFARIPKTSWKINFTVDSSSSRSESGIPGALMLIMRRMSLRNASAHSLTRTALKFGAIGMNTSNAPARSAYSSSLASSSLLVDNSDELVSLDASPSCYTQNVRLRFKTYD